MSHSLELNALIESRPPLITIESYEEPRLMLLLEQQARLSGQPLYAWCSNDGLRRIDAHNERVQETFQPEQALRHILRSPQNGIFVLLDIHHFLDNALVQRLVKGIVHDAARTARTLILLSPRLTLPEDLRRLAVRYEPPLPEPALARQLVKEEIDLWLRNSGERVKGERAAVDQLVRHLQGLSHTDVKRLAAQAIRDDGAITMADIERLHHSKYDMLGGDGLLCFERQSGLVGELAGGERLKHWLNGRRAAFLGNIPGLPAPKGVLLTGVQGCGKSFAARWLAAEWSLPLLRLDFGRLYNKYHGESERNLREALRIAESLAPCVLWIDEIEKGLAQDSGGEVDGGVSRRVLGTLLTWLSDRQHGCFIVATSNRIESLPPELIRKGRFDEIFFVDLPTAEIRAAILATHLRRRQLDPQHFDLPVLASASDGFSGAELEQAVVSALYQAHSLQQPCDHALLLAEIQLTRPLSQVMAEPIAALRHWAAGRTVAVD